jgi:uncharacterized iron-regulated protein
MPNKILETNAAVPATKKGTADKTVINEDEMKNSPLHKFFVSALKDIYYAENAILEALEKMQDAATSKTLRMLLKIIIFKPRNM